MSSLHNNKVKLDVIEQLVLRNDQLGSLYDNNEVNYIMKMSVNYLIIK